MAGSALIELVDRSLLRRADRPALEVEAADGSVVQLTFGEIDGRANRMAAMFSARGLRAGDRLAVHLANRLEFLDVFLAALRLGLVFVPVNVLYREREVAHIVSDAQPSAVVTTGDLAPLVPHGTPAWDVDALGAEAAAGAADPGRSMVEIAADAPAAIVYTSGTTGRAKGAVLTHANLAANARTLVAAWRITADDRYLAVLPLFHVHGLANGVLCWLASGCLLRLAPRFEHERARALFEEFRPTLFFGVPTVYVRLLELPEAVAQAIGARTRLFVSGSAPLPVTVFEAFRARFGHAILERYGMTETLMTIGNPYDGERRPGTVGFPLDGVSIRIVDPGGRDVADGETGELLVKGPAVFAGYWRRRGRHDRRIRRRLVPHGRPRLARRRRLRHAARPSERADPVRRVQRLPARDRGRSAGAAGCPRGGGRGRARRAPRRAAGGLLCGRRRAGRARGGVPEAAGLVQGTERVRTRRRAAAQRARQGGEEPAATLVRRDELHLPRLRDRLLAAG